MRNKGFIVFLTVIVTLLCLYYLSFTLVSRNIQEKATALATDEQGNVDFMYKQRYLDSIYNEPVYRFLGFDFTYKEIQDTELGLGLDLRGGMHVTLEVSPVDIVKGLSGNSEDEAFNQALETARVNSKTSQRSYLSLFYDAYKISKPESRLSEIFATSANRGKISFDSTDDEILAVIQDEIDDAIDRSFNILRTRIDRFGTSQPNIQQLQGTGRIQIELPGVDNPERVRKLLQGVAKLEFMEVMEINDLFPYLQEINDKLVAEAKAKAPATEKEEVEDTEEASLEDELTTEEDEDDLESLLGDGSDTLDEALDTQVSPVFALLQSQQGLIYQVKDTMKINSILQRDDVKSMLPRNIKLVWDVKGRELAEGQKMLELYAVKYKRGGEAMLTGEVITDASQTFDDRGQPAVDMSMNASGGRVWRKMTGDLIGRRIAIVLDNYVYSAPVVNSEIPNGKSIIQGNFTIEEAKDLSNILKAGSLPAPTRIVEEAIVGPTLGKEAQKQGVLSIIAGLGIVVVFMIAYYSKGGFVANIALVFNIFFILGILAQLSAALTLPGIAGIVLTIGMSIDANVLIFERIREELRNGMSLMKAISEGYSKAYSSIVDANLTTFIVGAILYSMGQGPVKGFAITLMIGIACSFFSAVFITRVIISWMSKKGDNSSISFATPFSKDLLADLNVNFLSKRKIGYIFSTIVIGLGMVLMITNGLNLGVDFKGGRSYVVSFSEPIVASDLKIALGESFEGQGTEVKTYGANNVLKITTSYLVEEDDTDTDELVQRTMIEGITAFNGFTFVSNENQLSENNFTISGSSKVGATIASDIKRSSQNAVIFSLIAIFIYILVRFRKWQFGLGAVVALFHDTLFVLALFAIAGLLGFNYEVDQVFIAAMLTVIGYSINDTVVVFDRIREYIGIKGKGGLDTFNKAINSTMNRTLITSVTTLVVVLVLFVFGGEVLRGFSFALIVGIVAGTYSSIFIATPIVLDLSLKMEKKEGAKKAQVRA